MIFACPACSASHFKPDGEIGAGVAVVCRRCRHPFHVSMAGARSAEPEPVEVDVDEIEDVTDAVESLDDAALFAAQLATQEFAPPAVAAPAVESTTLEVDTPALPMPASFAPTPWVEDNTLPTPETPAPSLPFPPMPAPLPPRGFESLAPLPLDPVAPSPFAPPAGGLGYGLGEESAEEGSANKTAVANVADLKRQIAEMTRLDPEDTPLAGDPLAGSGFEGLEPTLGAGAESPIESPAPSGDAFSVELPVAEPLPQVPAVPEQALTSGEAADAPASAEGAPRPSLPLAFLPPDDTISDEGVPPVDGPTAWPGSEDDRQGLPPAFDDPLPAFEGDQQSGSTSVTDLLAVMPPPAEPPPPVAPAFGFDGSEDGVAARDSLSEATTKFAREPTVAPAVVFPAVPEGSSTPSSLFDKDVQAAQGAHTQPEEDLQQIVSVARGQTRRFVAAAAVIAIGMVVAAYLATRADHEPQFAFVSEATVLRAGPGDTEAYVAVTPLMRGERVQVLEKVGPRALVRDALQRVGYVATAMLVDFAPVLAEGEPFYACLQAPLDGGPTTCQARAQAQRDACRGTCAAASDAKLCGERCDDRFVRCDAGCAAVLEAPAPPVAEAAREAKPVEPKPTEAATAPSVGTEVAPGAGAALQAAVAPVVPLTKAQLKKLEREKRKAAAKESRLAKQAKVPGAKKKSKAGVKTAPGAAPAPAP